MGSLDLLWLLGGAALGAAGAVLYLKTRIGADVERARNEGLERAARAEATAAAEAEGRKRAEAEGAALRDRAAALTTQIATAAEQLKSAERSLAEQKEFLAKSSAAMEAQFKAAAADALRGNHQQFLTLASERMESTQKPLKDTLDKLEAKTGEIEKARVAAYARIDEQVRTLSSAADSLQKGTTTLATALKSSQVRGRWGEIALKNVVELSGLTEHCDFREQQTADDGSRPDLTVNLPGGRKIAVDSKAPMDAYFRSAEAATDAERDKALDQHAAALRAHVIALSRRDYAKALGGGIDLVVLFLPGEPLLSAAFARDPELQTEALRQKILVATPVTLVALLRTVAIYYEQESIARNAQEIAACARDLYDRGATFAEHLGSVGEGLRSALKAFNGAVGSFEGRFLPMARRLEELKVVEQAKRRIEAPTVVEDAPRLLRSGDGPAG